MHSWFRQVERTFILISKYSWRGRAKLLLGYLVLTFSRWQTQGSDAPTHPHNNWGGSQVLVAPAVVRIRYLPTRVFRVGVGFQKDGRALPAAGVHRGLDAQAIFERIGRK